MRGEGEEVRGEGRGRRRGDLEIKKKHLEDRDQSER